MDGCFASFDHPSIVPVTKRGPLHFVDLWYGPTGSFKDFALLTLSRLLAHVAAKRNRKVNVVIETAGDTGGAAVHAMRDSPWLNVTITYPLRKISRMQELSMITVTAPNVVVLPFEGQVDYPMRRLFADREFSSKHQLMTLNSINFTRVLIHVVHHVYGFLQVCPEADREVVVAVPCGALGNLTGAYIAHEMGIPLRVLGATNDNDIAHTAFNGGPYVLRDTVLSTYACSMDVEVPYNIERLFYFLSGANFSTIKRMMTEFETTGSCAIPPAILGANDYVTTARITQEEIVATIASTWKDLDWAVCPHTATATAVALRFLNGELKMKNSATDLDASADRQPPVIVIATATAAKFHEVLAEAGVPVPSVAAMDRLARATPLQLRQVRKKDDLEAILRETIEGYA